MRVTKNALNQMLQVCGIIIKNTYHGCTDRPLPVGILITSQFLIISPTFNPNLYNVYLPSSKSISWRPLDKRWDYTGFLSDSQPVIDEFEPNTVKDHGIIKQRIIDNARSWGFTQNYWTTLAKACSGIMRDKRFATSSKFACYRASLAIGATALTSSTLKKNQGLNRNKYQGGPSNASSDPGVIVINEPNASTAADVNQSLNTASDLVYRQSQNRENYTGTSIPDWMQKLLGETVYRNGPVWRNKSSFETIAGVLANTSMDLIARIAINESINRTLHSDRHSGPGSMDCTDWIPYAINKANNLTLRKKDSASMRQFLRLHPEKDFTNEFIKSEEAIAVFILKDSGHAGLAFKHPKLPGGAWLIHNATLSKKGQADKGPHGTVVELMSYRYNPSNRQRWAGMLSLTNYIQLTSR